MDLMHNEEVFAKKNKNKTRGRIHISLNLGFEPIKLFNNLNFLISLHAYFEDFVKILLPKVNVIMIAIEFFN